MSEKLLHEIRIVETDDGFRIEIKGDKERLKAMLDKGAFPFGFGRMEGGHGPFHHRGPRGFGFRFGRRHGPWWSDMDEPFDEERKSKV
jgi:hypothetical protein